MSFARLILILLFLKCTCFYSQDSTRIICGFPATFPEYSGGKIALKQYLKDNIQFPKSVVDSVWNGKIVVKFYIDTLGFVQEPVIVKGAISDSVFQNKVISVVKSMPKWKPGTEFGKPKNYYYTLPISIKYL